MNDLYQEIIIEEYQHPRHKGQLLEVTHIGDGTNTSCGDSIKVFLRIQTIDAAEKVVDIAWEGDGCAISQATMSLLSQKIKQEQPTLNDLQHLVKEDMLALIGLDSISQARESCLFIGLKTVQQAQPIQD